MNTSVALLDQLVSYPTISSNPVIELAALLAQQAEDMGFKVYELQSSPEKTNILATLGPQEDSLVLSGHMDVVPTEGQNWSGDPFKLRQIDNRLYGRGTCDMKGFIASTMTTLKHLNLSNLKRGVALAWTHDEEVGCLGAQHLVSQIKDLGYVLPKSILIGEPTGMTFSRMHGGHTTVHIEIKGQAAHSSKPLLGCSAIAFAAEFIIVLQELQKEWQQNPIVVEGESFFPLLHVAQVEGGEAINIIPASCSLKVGLRAMPSQDSQDLVSEIHNRLQSLSNKSRWTRIHAELLVPQDAPPLHSHAGSALEKALIQQGCCEGESLPFSTDGGWFARNSSVPLVCGPGEIDIAHQPDEFITREDLAQCDVMLKNLISSWVTTESPR